jgi:trk system potassium uptake protein TrkA
MRYVIVGAGRVGLRTARVLDDSDHHVLLVDPDPEACERARNDGFDVIEGDGSLEEVLLEADVESADALGALSGDLNDNFAACLVAKQHDCRTVMRIDEDYREEIYRSYAEAVDEVIYPERLGGLLVKNALLGGNIRAIADIAPSLQLVVLTVNQPSPMRGYSLSELELPSNARLLAFAKGEDPLTLPPMDQSIEAGDRMVILADFDTLSDVRSLIVGDPSQAALGGA